EEAGVAQLQPSLGRRERQLPIAFEADHENFLPKKERNAMDGWMQRGRAKYCTAPAALNTMGISRIRLGTVLHAGESCWKMANKAIGVLADRHGLGQLPPKEKLMSPNGFPR